MKNLQSLRLLLADKDKEIEQLKKELTKEKNAYIKMYNMYVEKENIINELEKWLNEWKNWICMPDEFENGIISCINDTLDKLQELKGEEKE